MFIYYSQHVSELTFTMYVHSQKNKNPNNLRVFGSNCK